MNVDLMSSIEAIQRQTDTTGIEGVISRMIARRGFTSFIISGLPDPGVDVRPFVLLSGWPPEWYERYTGGGYVHFDPVARHCFATALPFDWADAPYDDQANLPARRVMDEAREFGMDEGFCVPIHLDGGMQGVVSLVGGDKRLDDRSRLELHMLALYAHGRLRFLHTSPGKPPSPRAITAREGEVLKWVAAGKTASEIAAITGLSGRTINQHCENAQRRLGTSNRVHTVVEALRQRLIAL